MNPVFYHPGGRIWDVGDPNSKAPEEPQGWYFWDETWAHYHGPFESDVQANDILMDYMAEL